MFSGMAQIAIRIADDDLDRLDAAVARGHYPTRAAAVRAGVELLIREEREREIEQQYRRAYADDPQDEATGRAGAALMAAVIATEETDKPDVPRS